MRKSLALLLVLTLVFTALPVYTSADSMEDVLKIVKERIPDTEEFTKFDSNSYTDVSGTAYSFYWSTENVSGKSLNVSVTEEGIITEYHCYGSKDTSIPTINKKTTDEVLPKAKELLKGLNPQISDKLVLKKASDYESLYDNNYHYVIEHYENGIPVYGDGGNMTVSADGTEIRNFSLKYTSQVDYTDTVAIDKETAEKLYGEKIGMTLYYMTKYDGRTKTAYPVYVPNDKGETYISAVSGESVTPIYAEHYLYSNLKGEAAEDSASGGASRFTEVEMKELEAIEGLISKEDAEKNIKSNKVLFPEDAAVTLKSSSLTKDYYDSDLYIYSLGFEGEGGLGVYTSLNAKTGEIIIFIKYGDYEEKEQTITEENALKLAESAVDALAGDKAQEYVLDEKNTDGYFSYTRMVNGIPYVDDKITVTVDLSDGSIIYYGISYSDIEFPSLENIVTEEQALKSMFGAVEYKPYYIPACSAEGMEYCDTCELVYMTENNYMPNVNAVTGEVKSLATDMTIPEYTDIEEHYAKEQIMLLRKFGIGFQSETFAPDEIITAKDFMALLVSVVNDRAGIILYDNYDYGYVIRRVKNKGIELSDEEMNQSLTREAAAVMMVKMLGYDEVAKIDGIYNCPFTDVADHVGYISILSGLGVINGNGSGMFNPDEYVTRADAAIMVYNYLIR